MRRPMVKFPASLSHQMGKTDDRQKKWREQRKNRGFDDTEIWNLDGSFACLMLPRVKLYVERCPFIKDSKWRKDMGAIIFALELMASGDCIFDTEQDAAIDNGLKKFAKHIRGMWI